MASRSSRQPDTARVALQRGSIRIRLLEVYSKTAPMGAVEVKRIHLTGSSLIDDRVLRGCCNARLFDADSGCD